MLSKDQAEQITRQSLEQRFSVLESRLDQKLAEGFRSFSYKDYFQDKDLLEYTRKQYSQAGWSVTEDSYCDFRDSWHNVVFS